MTTRVEKRGYGLHGCWLVACEDVSCWFTPGDPIKVWISGFDVPPPLEGNATGLETLRVVSEDQLSRIRRALRKHLAPLVERLAAPSPERVAALERARIELLRRFHRKREAFEREVTQHEVELAKIHEVIKLSGGQP